LGDIILDSTTPGEKIVGTERCLDLQSHKNRVASEIAPRHGSRQEAVRSSPPEILEFCNTS
jgi:hypothetical protein